MAISKSQIVEVLVKGEDRAQAVLNVLHYRIPSSSPDATTIILQDFVNALKTNLKAWSQVLMPNTYTVNSVEAFAITGRTPNPHWPSPGHPSVLPYNLVVGEQAFAAGPGWTGTRVGATLTSFTAYGVRHITVDRARKFRGSARWDIGTENDTDGNKWEAAFNTEVVTTQDYMNSLVNVNFTSGVDPALMVMCVFARRSFLKAANAPVPAVRDYSSEVQSILTNIYVTSQVSRKQRLRLQ